MSAPRTVWVVTEVWGPFSDWSDPYAKVRVYATREAALAAGEDQYDLEEHEVHS